jgi:regulatory protein
MKITAISAQIRDPDRVNVSIDGKYRFSLDISQIVSLGVKNGQEIDEERLAELERESEFGKSYTRTLEYCLMRPHSAREVRDYLYKKTMARKYKTRKGEVKQREGVSSSVADRVFDRLVERGYIDDTAFARYWVDNRNQAKGISRRKLVNELRTKGVDTRIIEQALIASERNEQEELAKIISKKRARYPDNQKLMLYLARQGFSYDDIKTALSEEGE